MFTYVRMFLLCEKNLYGTSQEKPVSDYIPGYSAIYWYFNNIGNLWIPVIHRGARWVFELSNSQ